MPGGIHFLPVRHFSLSSVFSVLESSPSSFGFGPLGSGPPSFWTSRLVVFFPFGFLAVCFSVSVVVALLIWFLCKRVDFVGAEELEDPAATAEAQQLAIKGKSWDP